MILKRTTAYLLFFVAYIGALVIEKPVYEGDSVIACFSYLLTVLVHFSFFALLIFTNRKLLLPRLLEKRRFGWYAGVLLLLIFLFTFLINNYNQFIHGVLLHDAPIGRSAGVWDTFVYALCCNVIVSMLYITEQWSQQQEQVKNIQISQLQNELKYLRSQINPHFLFNGLNTVYGYIDKTNRGARDIMIQFTDLLRYNLYEADVEMIELEKEAKYLQNYVALQKARSNENMEVNLQISCENGSLKIAPLIFMAFVENAFKHASRDNNTGNYITIALKEEGGSLQFTCDNSFEEAAASAGGIGLTNTVRRLELLYKHRYQLDIQNKPPLYHVHLKLAL
ncbi:MAG TPA: histidine kinase [Chitinophaga sp.]|uniref:sensor histidine kinase n=1 Tax=Chitinophaga sp. TaxID=1869181 RepID=UPI002DBAA7D3|nr:histidine kinase [Chitinophaga sp.]HEU4551512.1 histidine kinase [Chitinophaga sp.]